MRAATMLRRFAAAATLLVAAADSVAYRCKLPTKEDLWRTTRPSTTSSETA